MQLNHEQVQQLFSFTEKKFVRYYDLQVELVDHLAERIEEKMNEDAAVNFDMALQSVYKDFGIFGFAKIVQEKSEQLRKQNNRRLFKEAKNLFRWPEILSSLALALFIWTFLNIADKIHLDVFYISFMLISMGMIIWSRIKFRPSKKIMMTENMPDHLGMIPFLYRFIFFEDFFIHNEFAFALFMFCAIIFQVACFRISKKLRQEARDNYPVAFA